MELSVENVLYRMVHSETRESRKQEVVAEFPTALVKRAALPIIKHKASSLLFSPSCPLPVLFPLTQLFSLWVYSPILAYSVRLSCPVFA